MNLVIPGGLKGKSLFTWLKENKEDLIKQKKSLPIKSDPFTFEPEIIKRETTKISGKKEDIQDPELDQTGTANKDELLVKFIGNTMLYCDSQMDVLGIDSAKKTIKEVGPDGADRVYHLKDHGYCTTAIIGYVEKLYLQDFPLQDLGLKDKYGSTQCLIFESLVQKELSEQLFKLYKDKKITQHSIGLQYVKLELCINDSDEYYKEEFAAWNKYYALVINKDKVDQSGYFWYVPEFKLYEGSAVLFGANEITQTLTDTQSDNSTEQEHTSEIPADENKVSVLECLDKIKFN